MTLEQNLGRARRSVGEHGVWGLTRLGVAAARSSLLPSDCHIWYLLDLIDEHPVVALPEGFRLESPDELAPLDQLGPGALADAHARVRAGGVPWLVLDGDRVAFACWILPDVPTRAAPGGRLRLPDGVRCLEYSITEESYRGRGLAPAAWRAIADILAAEGVRALTTKVDEENVPSRRAVEKAGYREIGKVSVRRRAFRVHAELVAFDVEASAFIAAGIRR
jgi:GNAT superfamily N-acetyltransferase